MKFSVTARRKTDKKRYIFGLSHDKLMMMDYEMFSTWSEDYSEGYYLKNNYEVQSVISAIHNSVFNNNFDDIKIVTWWS